MDIMSTQTSRSISTTEQHLLRLLQARNRASALQVFEASGPDPETSGVLPEQLNPFSSGTSSFKSIQVF